MPKIDNKGVSKMPKMVQKKIQKLPLEKMSWLMSALVNAYSIGYPLNAVLHEAGIQFNRLFHTNHIVLYNDITHEGIQQITIHNYDNAVLIVRPSGIIKLEFEYHFTVHNYLGQGIVEVLDSPGNELKLLKIEPRTLDIHFEKR